MDDKNKKFRRSLGGAVAAPVLGLMSFFGSHAQGANSAATSPGRPGVVPPQQPGAVYYVQGNQGQPLQYGVDQYGRTVLYGVNAQGQAVVYGIVQQQGQQPVVMPVAGPGGQGNGVTVVKDGNGGLQAGRTTSVTAARQLEEGKPLEEVYDTARGVAAIGYVQLHAKKAENAGRVSDARTDATVASERAKQVKSENKELEARGEQPYKKAQGIVKGITGVLSEADKGIKKAKSTFDNAKKAINSAEKLFGHHKGKKGKGR